MSLPPLRDYQLRMVNDVGTVKRAPTVVQAVTGAGKSRTFFEIARRWLAMGKSVHVLINRRIVFDQLYREMKKADLKPGKIAAGHGASRSLPLQLGMIQTMVTQSKQGRDFKADLVIVDEAHLNAKSQTENILRSYMANGAYLVGFTATPVGVGHLYQRLVMGCNNSEARAAGAILMAKCWNVAEPDERFIKKVAAGSDLDGELSNGMQYLQQIVGRVYDHWIKINPQRLPTIAFAPGKPEAVWLANDLERRGVKAAHIDGEKIYYEGKYHDSQKTRDWLFGKLRAGEIEVIVNRFVLREGLDVTGLFCCLLCTRFGSEATYVQAVGRVLRAHPGMKHVRVADFGGNLRRFGSPNADREWFIDDTNASRAYRRKERERNGEAPEMITCPKCDAPRYYGISCPRCGYVASGLQKPILQYDGSLVRSNMRSNPPRRISQRLNAEDVWIRVWHSHRKKGWTFRKAFATFSYKMAKDYNDWNTWPNPEWTGMPMHLIDHHRKIIDVKESRLWQGGPRKPRTNNSQ